MPKRFWLAYDFGIDGDYDGLFTWLDGRAAVECGDNIASFKLDVGVAKDIPAWILKQIKKAAKLRPRDRLYLIHLESGKMKGNFIHGQRRRAPWTGYVVPGGATEDVD